MLLGGAGPHGKLPGLKVQRRELHAEGDPEKRWNSCRGKHMWLICFRMIEAVRDEAIKCIFIIHRITKFIMKINGFYSVVQGFVQLSNVGQHCHLLSRWKVNNESLSHFILITLLKYLVSILFVVTVTLLEAFQY